MTEADEDRWPMPVYRTVGAKLAHAMGVVTLNFNNLEFVCFRLYAHHLERMSVPLATAWAMYSPLQEGRRGPAIEHMFATAESDDEVKGHVEYALSGFNTCQRNRSWLSHGRTSDLPAETMKLSKTNRDDWSRINVLGVSLADVRRVADECFAFWEYGYDIWSYLQGRDLKDRLPAFQAATSRTTLPERPALPHSLDPSQIPRPGSD